MFSSEGDLHLELPSGERDGSKEVWVRFFFYAVLYYHSMLTIESFQILRIITRWLQSHIILAVSFCFLLYKCVDTLPKVIAMTASENLETNDKMTMH